MADTPWEMLGRAIYTERCRRWRNRADFARAAGLSVRTIVDLEHGVAKDYRPETLAAVEVALQWAPGDTIRCMQGGRPSRNPELQHVITAWPKLDRQVRAAIVGIVDDALGAE